MLSLYLLLPLALGIKRNIYKCVVFPRTLLSVLPIYLANISLTTPLFLTSFVAGLSEIITYPLSLFFVPPKFFWFRFLLWYHFWFIYYSMVNCFKAFICYFQLTIVFFLTLIAILKSLIFLILVAQYIYIIIFFFPVLLNTVWLWYKTLIIMKSSDFFNNFLLYLIY